MTANAKLYFGPSLPSFFMQGKDSFWLSRQQGKDIPNEEQAPPTLESEEDILADF